MLSRFKVIDRTGLTGKFEGYETDALPTELRWLSLRERRLLKVQDAPLGCQVVIYNSLRLSLSARDFSYDSPDSHLTHFRFAAMLIAFYYSICPYVCPQNLESKGDKEKMAKPNTGYVFKDKYNRWFARTSYVDETGKRRNVKKCARDRAHGREVLKKLLRDLEDHGTKFVEAANMTFDE